MSSDSLLGSYRVHCSQFPDLETVFAQFEVSSFQSLSQRKKFTKVNKTLLDLIQQAEAPCFLLPAVIDFITRVNSAQLLKEPYRMTLFEFWLNHFSHLGPEENMNVRGKIVGKAIPREDYQLHFPIGMARQFSGTHFVVAHLSPDVDASIASFWGWVDAFAAKVGSGVHQWCLPTTIIDTHLKELFQQLFTPGIFSAIPREELSLTLTALDLVTKKDVVKFPASVRSSLIDHASLAGKPVLLVSEEGFLQGDWKASDSEIVRQVVLLFTSMMRWFESTIHASLIASLAQEDIQLIDVQGSLDFLSSMTVKTSEPLKEVSEKQRKYQNDFLKKILLVKSGLVATFTELCASLDAFTGSDFASVFSLVKTIDATSLFERPKLFSFVQNVFTILSESLSYVRQYVDRMDILLQVKDEVLTLPSHFVSLKSDVEEIRMKMDNFDYLTVVIPEGESSWFPVGVIYANDVKKQTLGTVSVRDFSNEEEMKMASYLEVISVIDHHKTAIRTSIPATMLIADTQSANTLTAELAMKINDRYSVMGISLETIEEELHACQKQDQKVLDAQIHLLQLKRNHLETKYFIHQDREFSEYFCFLCAILDDTDLLTKVSDRDVECVARLLNKMKSISTKRLSESICLADLIKDASFAKKAATRILQNQDMHSIYKKIYELKEQEVEVNLAACISEKPSSIFADTKEQNGCCRIGQTKLFSTNIPLFEKYAQDLRMLWLKEAKKVATVKPHIDFHMHMISTIAGAEEVYKGHSGNWSHQDELWIWIPPMQQAAGHLVNFLSAFQASQAATHNIMSVEFTGANWQELDLIFSQNFPKAIRKPKKASDCTQDLPIAILRFKAGLLNSRKAAITPFLPRFIP